MHTRFDDYVPHSNRCDCGMCDGTGIYPGNIVMICTLPLTVNWSGPVAVKGYSP